MTLETRRYLFFLFLIGIGIARDTFLRIDIANDPATTRNKSTIVQNKRNEHWLSTHWSPRVRVGSGGLANSIRSARVTFHAW